MLTGCSSAKHSVHQEFLGPYSLNHVQIILEIVDSDSVVAIMHFLCHIHNRIWYHLRYHMQGSECKCSMYNLSFSYREDLG